MDPYQALARIDELLASGAPEQVLEALDHLDAFRAAYPGGRPQPAFTEALTRLPPGAGPAFRRLVPEVLAEGDFGEAGAAVEALWAACQRAAPDQGAWLVDAMVERCLKDVEPGHLDPEHPLLALLAGRTSELGRVLLRTLEAGHFASFGGLLEPYLDTAPPAEEEAAVLDAVARAVTSGEGLGFVSRLRPTPRWSAEAARTLETLRSGRTSSAWR